MSHVLEGTLTAIRDGALVDADDTVHLSGCDVCTGELARLTERSTRIAASFDHFEATIDVERAKEAVRARLDRKRAAERPRRSFSVPVGRAAALLLVAAGAVSALPGSPVRAWLGLDAPAVSETTTGAMQQDPGPAGIEVPVSEAGVTIALRGVPVAEEIEVEWIDEAIARISAADGSSYSVGDRRAEAVVTGGPVVVALPRSAPVVLEINGVVMLTRSSGSVSMPLGSVSSNENRITLSVPDR